ncbi:MAG: ABC transporter permease [Ardenticatenaceae bacterium]|nr:ABC transporter permease [Anaerolineales bacterium]MCB8941425.1 ABC transporter permease [Ardenticatenaceae bacterium]MCB8972781.1 ABC transporter permease [Ardenticatenaceae bacterium]
MSGYLLAELRHRLGRALGGLVGVALGVALYVGLTAVADGFAEAAKQPLAGIGADILLSRPAGESNATAQTSRGVRQPFGLAPLTLGDAADLGAIDGVGGVSGGLLLWDFGASSYQTLLGIEAETGVGPARASEWVVNGRFFQSDERNVVVVDRHFAAFFGLQPGMTHAIGDQTFTVIGVVEVPGGNQAAAANFYLPLADAQALAGLPADRINQIYLRVTEASDVEAVVAASEARLGDISALTEQSIVQVMGGVAQISDRFAGVTALAALLGGLILTGAALSANINLRTVEIGVMKATGWQERDVVRLFVAEGLALSLLGAALGILLGWLATLILSQIPVDLALLAGTTPNLGSEPEIAAYTLPARLSWNSVGVATAVAFIGGSLTSYLFARRAAHLKPADALRNQ